MDVFEFAARNHIAEIATIEPGKSFLRSLSGENLLQEGMPFEILPSCIKGSLEPARIDGEYGLLFKADDDFFVYGRNDKIGFKTRSLEICNETVTVPQEPIDLSKGGRALYQE